MPAMYVPLSQMESATLRLVHTWFSPHWVIRASGPRSSLIAAVNAAVQATDPMLPMAAFETVDDLKLASLEFQRFVTMLLSSLAVLALVLAIVGVYSLIANSVAERSRELGIRMALGSSVGEAVRTAIRPGLLWTGVGVVFGVAMGVWASRLLGSFVWGVGRMDPVTYGGVAVLLLVVAGVAAAGPGWRVSRLNPAETLRNE
jgi:ABC-type antimicrobial peptide transport system permease subunit